MLLIRRVFTRSSNQKAFSNVVVVVAAGGGTENFRAVTKYAYAAGALLRRGLPVGVVIIIIIAAVVFRVYNLFGRLET